MPVKLTRPNNKLRAYFTTTRSRYLALVFCGDTGLERGAKPDRDLSPTRSVWRFHVPRIWIRSIGLGRVGVKKNRKIWGTNFHNVYI
jgi:hypothetical protein